MSAPAALEAKCAELAEHLAADMAREGLRAKTLTLKLKLTSFELRTRAASLERHICKADDILAVALRLLRAEYPLEIRLMGLRMSGFWEQTPRAPGQKRLEDVLGCAVVRAREGTDVSGRDAAPQSRAASSSGDTSDDRCGPQGHAAESATSHATQLTLSQAEVVELSLQGWAHQASQTDQDGSSRRGAEAETGCAENEGVAAEPVAAEATAVSDPRTPADSSTSLKHSTPSTTSTCGPPPGQWVCPACTLFNQATAVWCEVCGARRPAPQKRGLPERRGSAGKRRAGAPATREKTRTLDRFFCRGAAGPGRGMHVSTSPAEASRSERSDHDSQLEECLESADLAECRVCGYEAGVAISINFLDIGMSGLVHIICFFLFRIFSTSFSLRLPALIREWVPDAELEEHLRAVHGTETLACYGGVPL